MKKRSAGRLLGRLVDVGTVAGWIGPGLIGLAVSSWAYLANLNRPAVFVLGLLAVGGVLLVIQAALGIHARLTRSEAGKESQATSPGAGYIAAQFLVETARKHEAEALQRAADLMEANKEASSVKNQLASQLRRQKFTEAQVTRSLELFDDYKKMYNDMKRDWGLAHEAVIEIEKVLDDQPDYSAGLLSRVAKPLSAEEKVAVTRVVLDTYRAEYRKTLPPPASTESFLEALNRMLLPSKNTNDE